MDEKYMNIAIKESKKSYKDNDIPVGAVIIKNDKVISKSHNKCKNKVHSHAEILAINKAMRKIGDSYLDDCVIYTTMEPCLMCYGAILHTNIKKIVCGVSNEKEGFTKMINRIPKQELIFGICSEEIKKILNKFFKSKRN